MKYGKSGVLICEIICQNILKRATSKRPTCQKLAFWGKLSLRFSLCSNDSIQIPLNLIWVLTFRPKSNMRLLAVYNKSTKTKNSEKKNSLFFLDQTSKTAWQSHVLIKDM